MIKKNYDIRNYVYIASTTDEYENITEIADTMKELADLLKIDESAVSRMLTRHTNNESKKYLKGRKIERVKIYDYVFIVYEHDITQPLYVSRDLHNISKMSGFSLSALAGALYNRQEYERKRKSNKPQIRKLQYKYLIQRVDLLDLNFELAQYLESCIDKGKILELYEKTI